MPGFIVLLLLMALNRSNPKLGRVGEAGEQAVDDPLPQCFEAMLQKNVLKRAKRSKMSSLKSELNAANTESLFSQASAALKKDFEKVRTRRRRSIPALSSHLVPSRPISSHLIAPPPT
jgi:hypothetical protein